MTGLWTEKWRTSYRYSVQCPILDLSPPDRLETASLGSMKIHPVNTGCWWSYLRLWNKLDFSGADLCTVSCLHLRSIFETSRWNQYDPSVWWGRFSRNEGWTSVVFATERPRLVESRWLDVNWGCMHAWVALHIPSKASRSPKLINVPSQKFNY